MKVGIVGCGLVGQKRAKQLPGAEIWAACDSVSARLNAIELDGGRGGWYVDYDTMLRVCPELDIVIVATDHAHLAEVAMAAMKAGKHVLIEKPAGMNIQEVREIQRLLRETPGVRVRVGFNHRYHPAIRQANNLIGRIGTLYHLRIVYGHGGREGYDKEWRMNPATAAGGELVEQGIHAIDLAQWFLGRLDHHSSVIATSHWDTTLDDNAFLLLRSRGDKNVATAQIHVSCTEWKNKFEMTIVGSKGSIVVSGLGGSYGIEKCTWYLRPYVDSRQTYGVPETSIWEYSASDFSWATEFESFVNNIRSGISTGPGLEDAISAWQIIEDAYASRGNQTSILHEP